MDREFLIEEIRRIAATDGKPPGQKRFRQETGVTVAQWRGKLWTTWKEALAEAGFEPNSLATAFDKGFLLEKLAEATRKLGKFPTHAELMMHARRTEGFPERQSISAPLSRCRSAARGLGRLLRPQRGMG